MRWNIPKRDRPGRGKDNLGGLWQGLLVGLQAAFPPEEAPWSSLCILLQSLSFSPIAMGLLGLFFAGRRGRGLCGQSAAEPDSFQRALATCHFSACQTWEDGRVRTRDGAHPSGCHASMIFTEGLFLGN